MKPHTVRYPTDFWFECWAITTFSGVIFFWKTNTWLWCCSCGWQQSGIKAQQLQLFSTPFILVVKRGASDQDSLRSIHQGTNMSPWLFWKVLAVTVVDVIQILLVLLVYSFAFIETKIGQCTVCLLRER